MAICSYLVTSLVPHRTPFLLLAALLIPTIVCAADFNGRVVGVIDGDTIEVLNGHHAERIRLSEIDCPNYSQIAPRNKVAFNSPAEAEEAGYRVARNCA
jgi:endonuclease YncB( thermonuclease family)